MLITVKGVDPHVKPAEAEGDLFVHGNYRVTTVIEVPSPCESASFDAWRRGGSAPHGGRPSYTDCAYASVHAPDYTVFTVVYVRYERSPFWRRSGFSV